MQIWYIRLSLKNGWIKWLLPRIYGYAKSSWRYIYSIFINYNYIKFLYLKIGTGSGLGSYIVEQLTENYEDIPILNMCVMPHLTGEVILQSYNCILTIASLYQNSNGLIII